MTEDAASSGAAERMQALLARAAQEQLSEQRGVANALAEVRAQVAAVGEGLRGAASGMAVERLRSDLAVIADVVLDLRTAAAAGEERLGGLTGQLDDHGRQLVGAGSGSADVAARLDALVADVAGLGRSITRTADVGRTGGSGRR